MCSVVRVCWPQAARQRVISIGSRVFMRTVVRVAVRAHMCRKSRTSTARNQMSRFVTDGPWGLPAAPPGDGPSDVEVRHREGVLLDELTARLDLFAHQQREDLVRLNRV